LKKEKGGRVENRKYENEKPISDMIKVLLLLNGEFGDKTSRRLEIRDDEPPFVKVEHYGGHHDEVFSTEYYLVTKKVVEALRQEGFIEGVPQLGYTSKSEIRLTDLGRDRLRPKFIPTPASK